MRQLVVIFLFLGSLLSGGLATASFSIAEDRKRADDQKGYLQFVKDSCLYMVLASVAAFTAGMLSIN